MMNMTTEMVLLLVFQPAFTVGRHSSVSHGLPGGKQVRLHKGSDSAWCGSLWGSPAAPLCVASMHAEALKCAGLRAASLCTNSFYF